MYTHALRFLACATIAVPASAAASTVDLATRPYGHALGDGLQHSEGLALGQGAAPVVGKDSCGGADSLFGIDVSYYQGDIDWNAVAADGVAFAWVRVSHALQFDDPKFQQNLAGSRAAGIHTGVYQYFEPGQDPVAQAQKLLDLMGPLQPGDMPPMIDIETTDAIDKGAYADAVRAWLDHIEAATGTVPFIYTGFYYWNDHLGTDEFVDHPLWIANYNDGCPLIPDYWPAWAMHQYCACGSIAGIAGDVDADTFNGNLAQLESYAFGGQEVCGDGTCVAGEDPYNCASDCPPCGLIPAEGGTIDNGQACLELYGPAEYWRSEAVGQGGSLNWTNVTEYADPSNYAVYRLVFAETGVYNVAAWIEQPFGETAKSKYQVVHADGETLVPISQKAQPGGWVGLGQYTFNASTDHYVRINDNTGEPVALELSLVADALQITRVDGEAATTSAGGSTGDVPGTGDATAGGSDASTTDAPTTGTTVDATTTAASSSSDTTTADADGDDGGCGCRSNSDAGWLSLLATVGLARRRRRR